MQAILIFPNENFRKKLKICKKSWGFYRKDLLQKMDGRALTGKYLIIIVNLK